MVFACVGRLVEEKGVNVLLEASSILLRSGFRLRVIVVGDGPERERLETQNRAAGTDGVIEFTGMLVGEALARRLDGVDAIVMPSICEETAGLSAMEQMERGRLVIASDIGGLSEIVGDAGLKFRPGDAAGLAAAMQSALVDPGLVEDLGRKGAERARRLFLSERMVLEHLEAYQPGGAGT